MKTFLVIGFFILVSLNSRAQSTDGSSSGEGGGDGTGIADNSTALDPTKLQKPKGRQPPKPMQPPNESSSFIGDPDSLDPLNVRDESLREDDEPVLEDIKDVLNSESKKKPENGSEGATPTPTDSSVDVSQNSETPPVVESQPAAPSVGPDDPDLAIEKKFHEIYQTYNKNPTPDDIWAAASGKQTARLYEVQKGDTLWSISKILFGDPNFWPKLWAINKQGILNPHFINPKMKIFFYEGTEEEAPTLTVGENEPVQQETTAATETATAEPAKKDSKKDETKPQLVTEEQPIQDAGKVPRNKYKPLGKIPPSLPEGRNLVYYGGSSKDKVKPIRVDLGNPPKSEYFYNNDIVITDIDVKSDVTLKVEEVQKMRCSPGRIFKDISYSGTLVEQYDIYEKLAGVQTSTGFKYTYRHTGRAKSYKDKYISVIECNSFVSTDLIFVPRDQMKELATQKISDVERPVIIGAPDNNEQKFYATLQYAFVDFGPQKYDIGQSFKLMSELTDEVNGEFKVIDKFGSYAVVIMTDTKEQINIGDKVELQ